MSTSLDVTKIIGHKYKPYTVDLKDSEMILYALSIGFNKDPMNIKDFKFTYELDENFTGFTTMPVVIAHRQLGEVLATPNMPEINPMMFLHGEEYIELFKPITSGMKILVEEKVIDF